jgi:hypothetical protein
MKNVAITNARNVSLRTLVRVLAAEELLGAAPGELTAAKETLPWVEWEGQATTKGKASV